MNPMQWTWDQWVNFVAIGLPLVVGGGWYTSYVSAEFAALMAGASSSIVGLLNLMLKIGGKPAVDPGIPSA